MKNNNVIDLTNYFVQSQIQPERTPAESARRIIHAAGRIIDVASTAAIAVCLFACLMLFFTML